MSDITEILGQFDDGDSGASERLLELVYEELRKLAAAKLANEHPGQTLQATALVHEAYMRLVGKDHDVKWNSRGHFFGAAANAMRRILIDEARRKQGLKYGDRRLRVSLTGLDPATLGRTPDLLALDEALEQFEEREPEVSELVKLRFYAGLTIKEAALAMDISVRTANRDWEFARAWLLKRLTDSDASSTNSTGTE